MRSADMVHMTMGEDEVLNPRRIESRPFDVLNDFVESESRTSVDEDRFSEIKEINGTVPRISHVRTCHTIDYVMYSLLPHRL